MIYWAAAGLGVGVGALPPLGLLVLACLVVATCVVLWFRRLGMLLLFASLLVTSGNLWDLPLPGRMADVALGEYWLALLTGLGAVWMLASRSPTVATERLGIPWRPLGGMVLVGLISLFWNGAQGRWDPLTWQFSVGGWGLLVLTAAAFAVPAVLVPDARWATRCLGTALLIAGAVLAEELVHFLGRSGGFQIVLANKYVFVERFPFLAVLALLVLSQSAGILSSGSGGRWRLVALVLLPLGGIMILLTVARAVWLGAVAGLLWLAWRTGRGRVYLVVMGVGVVAALSWGLLVSLFGQQEANWEASRLRLWKDGWRIFLDHWLMGAGPGSYYEFAKIWDVGILVGSAHNNYVQVAAELGVVGLVACASVIWSVWRLLAERVRACPPGVWRALALGGEASLIGLLVASWFGDYLFVSMTNSGLDTFCIVGYFWLLAGLAAASRRWIPVPAAGMA